MSLRPIAPNDEVEARAIAVITLAFSADPVVRWVFPDPAAFFTYFPRFVRAFGGRAFEQGTAACAADGSGAALWLPPGIHPDGEAIGAIIEECVPLSVRDTLSGFVEQQAAAQPVEPYWYLPLIGVDPARQGEGIGSRLLSQTLASCDRDGLPAYLEATTLRSRALYERHGFEVKTTVQVPGSPPMWPMLRRPR